ncbi:MAG: hypothetical protein ABIQ29_09325 [Burkholderiaceae bacterium]
MASLMRNAYTAVIARGELWQGSVQTEPYEAAWAGEAVFFVHVLEANGSGPALARVQISPDGMHWVDEGAELPIQTKADHLSFARVVNFGGWLRLSVTVPPSAAITVVATLALKA